MYVYLHITVYVDVESIIKGQADKQIDRLTGTSKDIIEGSTL